MQPSEVDPRDLETQKLFDLKGKVALITGASGALGSAVAKGLAVNGVDLALSSVEEDALRQLSDETRALGARALPVYCDVVSESQVDAMVDKAVAEFGKIDILFTAAGLAHRAPLIDQSLEDWRRVMDVNVQGTLLCCKAVARDMIKRGQGGSIITVGSVRGFHGHKDGYTGYGTSKAAIHYLTKTLAFEWAEHNIRVNCIAPCMFWSALTAPVLKDPATAQKYISRIPMGRAAVPEDFVGAVIFLASSAGSMVTAHVLSVDGGVLGG
ncbi:MAG: 2-deoxy-D-gluconate 3-dehydrogenase [Deltaproteobacteria bacterium HGW-Deltaproteobacteria-21]|nr:MAG: 2-deoxy-D-gluconate 3-dehydrogenase [Deltaproteobacteria bacterium HGW-Deltaproteobacteria-21]